MRKDRSIKEPSVNPRRTYVKVFGGNIRRLNRKRLSVFKFVFHFRKKWRTQNIYSIAGIYRIKATRAQNIPSRHLTTVLIADQSVRRILVKVVHDLSDV